MGHHTIEAGGFQPVAGETFPEYAQSGTNFNVGYHKFAATDNANEAIQVVIGDVQDYASALIVDFFWFADNATTGDALWDVRVAALTSETDTQDVTTDALAAASSVTDTHLGTTSKRLHKASVTVSAVDGLASGDKLVVVCRRNTTAANADTMANDACLERVVVRWS